MKPRRYLSVVGASALSLFLACSGANNPSVSVSGEAGTTGTAGTTGSGGTTGTAGGGGPGGGSAASGGGGGGGTTGGGGSAASGGGGGGAATGSGGTAAGTGGTTALTLDQVGNPISAILNTYTTWLAAGASDAARLAADKTLADNMITWQMPHGGFYKNDKTVYAAPWNGSAARSGWLGASNVELGTIDNNGTVTETMFLADVYRRSSEAKYRDAARKALDFILTMQYPSGGLPQVYPARVGTTYSNHVTFNDDAMVRALALLDRAVKKTLPLDGDIFTADQLTRSSSALAKGIDFILKSQIVQNGVKTVWCAQHDPTTYVPRGARSYELPSKSGSESIGVIAFLMTQPQTPEVKAAAQAAIAWFKSDSVKVANTAYVSRPSNNTDDTYNPIQARAGSTMWFRFYDLDQDVGFFSGRLPSENPPGAGKQYDIMDIEAERRYGYQWGGNYGTVIFTYSDRFGY